MVSSVVLTALLLVATAYDLTKFRIPNMIPLVLVGLFILKISGGIETGALTTHVILATLALVLGFLAFVAGLLGGGDAKLIAALALWFGPDSFAEFITITGIIGGLVALLLILLRRLIRVEALSVDGMRPSSAYHILDKSAPLPYALPIAAAALWLEWSQFIV